MLSAPTERQWGDRVIRAYRVGDASALKEAVEASYEHLAPMMPWAKRDYPIAEAEATIDRMRSAYDGGTDYALGLWEGELLLGGTGFHLRQGPREWLNAEIGMWIRASESGRGLGSDLLVEMMNWAFTEWPFERLVWRCDIDNLASERVARKAGLRQEGHMVGEKLNDDGSRSDMLFFAILKSEWETR